MSHSTHDQVLHFCDKVNEITLHGQEWRVCLVSDVSVRLRITIETVPWRTEQTCPGSQ
jgi:hypothetical protein